MYFAYEVIHEDKQMLKLYRSMQHSGAWIAYSRDTGWVVFEQRQPCRSIDPVHLRQVPAGLAAAPPEPRSIIGTRRSCRR